MHQAICSQACLWTTFLLFLVSTCLINKSKVKIKFDLFINKQTLTSFSHSVILETLLWDACWTNSRALLMVLKSSQINCIIIFFTHYSPIVPVPPSTIFVWHWQQKLFPKMKVRTLAKLNTGPQPFSQIQPLKKLTRQFHNTYPVSFFPFVSFFFSFFLFLIS